MKYKSFFLSTIISSCVFTFACYADQGDRPCYPASKCVGDPNLMGRSGGYGYQSNNSASTYGQGMSNSKQLQTESTDKFVGTVKSVNRVTLPNQTQIQIVLSTDQGDVLVIVGPSNFVDQAKVKIQAGDKVTVTGYRVRGNGQEVVLAAEIQKNGYTLQLLDENRQPLWAPEGGGNQGMQTQKQQQYSGSGYSGSQNPKMPNSHH